MAWNENPVLFGEPSETKKEAGKENADSVSAYLERIRQICGEGGLFVFRGEPGIYERPCIPGIFRTGILKENPLFERQLLDALRQREAFAGKGDLETAMEVQDGRVLSRLLSVTWNCLIALYFAAGPGMDEGKDGWREKDGAVYVIRMASVFQPGGENIRQSFQAAVGGGMGWQKGQELLGGNHKLVDGQGRTAWIAAQRGGFILFAGDQELPSAAVGRVRIPAGAREGILRELKDLFGMGPGSLFPGAAGLAQEMMEAGRRMDLKPFSCENEFLYAMDRLEAELKDGLRRAAEYGEKEPEKGWLRLEQIERLAGEAYTGLLQLTAFGAGEEQRQAAPAVMERYNQIVRELAERASELKGMAGELSCREVGGLCRLKAERTPAPRTIGGREEKREAASGHRQRKSPQPNDRVTRVRLGNRSFTVKNATEAMLETVQYVLDTCKPEENWLLAACGSWLNSDSGYYERQELYFRGTEKTVKSGNKTYWVGTGSNSQKKCRQIKELCGLAGVPEHTVYWYTDAQSEPLFAW